MPRFFITPEQIRENRITLSGPDALHAARVLRMRTGDPVVFSDGRAYEYHARITDIKDDRMAAEILSRVENRTEPEIRIVLCQALPKGDKMDFIIQKAVELGVHAVLPVITCRTIPDIKDKGLKKAERWARISAEAAKQCGRGILPIVEVPVAFCGLLYRFGEAFSRGARGIMPWEMETGVKLSDTLKKLDAEKVRSLWVFIGPEGGIAPGEAEDAKAAGFLPVTMGRRILRTETAAIAALSSILCLYGEF
ncbi:MAG TPA: 16S rRNA (uracil(1498)-N(3))-methyltransferase [Clostridiales bacterium]|nr:16S rRNA (uracil(1498)-N(3))-methyltransferase [Clostridiales bacterium]